MSNTLKDLDTSRREALQGLLGSLGHVDVNGSPSAGKLSPEQARKLSEKIKEILGDDENPGSAREDQPKQLLSEDGLPIVDINEAIENSQMGTSSAYVSDLELIPPSLLQPDERERRRRERDRILDLLEEEERLQHLREERDAEEKRNEAIKKRKETIKTELAHLKAARELQKKMGQALLRGLQGTGDDKQDEDARSKPQLTSSTAKKSVSFADAPAIEDNGQDNQPVRQPDWGDVTPGRLRAQNRVPLVSSTEAQNYPMKLHVVERHPTTTAVSPIPDADSDDESPSGGQLSPHAGSDLSNEEESDLSSNGDVSDNEPMEEAFDYDAVQHHREIALEYHKKRHAIGAEITKALAGHDLDDEEWHESYIKQSPLSHFRAVRMTAAYDKSHPSGPVSRPIEQNINTTSRQESLRNSVRLGKLEDGQLVGGESGESGSEGEAVKEMIQLLRVGNIENIGPDFQPSTLPPLKNASIVEPTTMEASGVARGIKQSRFKLARGDGITKGTQDDQSGDHVQPQPAMSSVVERKAPRSSQRFPINKLPSQPPVNAPESSPMIIHSPSFPATSAVAIRASSATTSDAASSPINRTQAGYPPLPVAKGKPSASAVQNSKITFQASSCDSSPMDQLTSRFIAERKGSST